LRTQTPPLSTPCSVTCTLSTLTLLTWFAMIQSPTEITPIARPPRTPRSKPINATHGANATTPSLLDHEKAIIKPHVAARPATAT